MSEEREFSPNSSSFKDRLVKGLYLVLFAILFDLVQLVVVLIALVQYILLLTTGATLPRLRELGLSLGRYLKEIVGFLTFEEDHAPYPFSHWPGESDTP